MTKRTDAAVITAKRCQGQATPDIKGEWQRAIQELNAYDEGCPRCAFIGLCEEGMVVGIPRGNYGLHANNKNKRYAVAAARLILDGHEPDPKAIWHKVTDKRIQPHEQVGIVIVLHANGLLCKGEDNPL